MIIATLLGAAVTIAFVVWRTGMRLEIRRPTKKPPVKVPNSLGTVSLAQAAEALSGLAGACERLQLVSVREHGTVDFQINYIDTRSGGNLVCAARGYAKWHHYPDGTPVGTTSEHELDKWLCQQRQRAEWGAK